MHNACASLPDWVSPLMWLVIFAWEAWVGRNKPADSSSTVELLIKLVKKLARR